MTFDFVYLLAIVGLFIALLAIMYAFYELFSLGKNCCERIIHFIIVNRRLTEIKIDESLDHARETLLSEIIKNLPMEELNDNGSI